MKILGKYMEGRSWHARGSVHGVLLISNCCERVNQSTSCCGGSLDPSVGMSRGTAEQLEKKLPIPFEHFQG